MLDNVRLLLYIPRSQKRTNKPILLEFIEVTSVKFLSRWDYEESFSLAAKQNGQMQRLHASILRIVTRENSTDKNVIELKIFQQLNRRIV